MISGIVYVVESRQSQNDVAVSISIDTAVLLRANTYIAHPKQTNDIYPIEYSANANMIDNKHAIVIGNIL